MNNTYLIAAAAFVVGMMMAKQSKPENADTSVHNDVSVKGDWWTYPGMWSAN